MIKTRDEITSAARQHIAGDPLRQEPIGDAPLVEHLDEWWEGSFPLAWNVGLNSGLLAVHVPG